jgi:hypothetical protein
MEKASGLLRLRNGNNGILVPYSGVVESGAWRQCCAYLFFDVGCHFVVFVGGKLWWPVIVLALEVCWYVALCLSDFSSVLSRLVLSGNGFLPRSGCFDGEHSTAGFPLVLN